MKERIVDLRTGDGVMKTFVTYPEDGGPFPPVVLYMDIWGVRAEFYDIARRLAAEGFACILPDLYYRQGDGVHTEFRDEEGRMISLHRLDPERERQVHRPREKLTGAMAMADTESVLGLIDAEAAMRPGPVGSIGWCMGGWLVLAAAGHYPERFRAGASLHGTRLVSETPDSPHLLAERFRGELYCGFGELDHLSPPAMAEELSRLLAPCDVDYRYVVHKGVEHGYALPDRDIYDSRAAARDWEMIHAMFRRQLASA
jgi:carboxymethylenebutenolidase